MGGAAPAPVASELTLDDFAYDLPPELIAQEPLARRDASRLLVLRRAADTLHHSRFADLESWLRPGDLLVANNSRVIPARLHGRRLPTGGAVEVLLLRENAGIWSALARPAKRLAAGARIEFPSHRQDGALATAEVTDNLGEGEIRLRFDGDVERHLEEYGETPLPPYITAPLADGERYQTVYSTVPGSAAAPTAGLHFTAPLIDRLRDAGVGWEEVTLHVGLDTFRPVNETRIAEHSIHQEWCEVSDATADAIAACSLRGGRVVAVGTTAARTLETLGRTWRDSAPRGYSEFTDLFIVPGFQWRLVDGMVTNFHLPKSTLVMMVSALAGRERILAAYEEAIRERYRFYSFGDAMLIL